MGTWESKNNIGFNEQDFESFFKKNYKLALYISLKITNNLESSEDIVQDTFLWIWNNAEVIQQGNTLKSLLKTIVKNKSLNYIRDKKKLHNIEVIQSTFPENKYDYEQEEKIAKIIEQIDSLPPRCKRIFDLVIFKKKKYEEVAILLGITKNTVKTQMGIAYKQLRKINFSLFLFFSSPFSNRQV